ncbi:acetyl-coenzyme A carboxylase carboxyl transferase subunit alpha [Alphaproteobacteria bacterium]|nr:acetyl-coenzyme A carboxylase carboxyl transferase subunit alpha [Alphaproteobacteria bacterium]
MQEQEYTDYLDFERPIAELESKVEGIRRLSQTEGLNIAREVAKLEDKLNREIVRIYTKLTPWQTVQVARHPRRPHALAYICRLFTEFTPLAGDRSFGDDKAVIGGLARFGGRPCVVVGQEKGHDISTRIEHNFGMPYPEGYRKAIRLMDLAERFGLPLLAFVDTAGAYPGIEAEERGQAQAIAAAMEKSATLTVPFVSTIIGEGGSGGAIALATANRVLMLGNAIYSVISPEGASSILWKSAAQAKTAAEAMRITAPDLKKLGVIDEIVEEPLGGAHRDPDAAIDACGRAIEAQLKLLDRLSPTALRAQRKERFLRLG